MSVVLKWAWRYGSLEVDSYGSLREAMEEAEAAADRGDEALAYIEVVDSTGIRYVSMDEVRTALDHEDPPTLFDRFPMWAPSPWAAVRLVPRDVENPALLTYVYDEAEAAEAERYWSGVLGAHRVQVKRL